MRYLLLSLILFCAGCVSLQGKPINKLNIDGNPYVTCDNGVEGRFVCRKEFNQYVVGICKAAVENKDEGFMVIENGGDYLFVNPKNVQCFLSDERR